MQRLTLRQARRRHTPPLTQEMLEAASGVNQSIISRVERGEVTPETGTIAKLAAALKVKPDQLRFGALVLVVALLAGGCESPAAPSTARRAVHPIPVVVPAGGGR